MQNSIGFIIISMLDRGMPDIDTPNIKTMLTAMMERTLQDLFARNPDYHFKKAAKLWINSNSQDSIFNFRYTCEILDICPDKLRDKISFYEKKNFKIAPHFKSHDTYVLNWFNNNCGNGNEPVLHININTKKGDYR